MDYNLPKPYLSASQIQTLFRCGKQYEFKYIENRRGKINIPMVQGTSVHKSLEMVYSDKKNGQTPLTPKQTADLAVYNFDESVKEAVEAEELDPIQEDKKDAFYSEVVPVTVDYVEHIASRITPIETEMEFMYTSRCGVDLLMYIDLVKQLHEDSMYSRSIVDYKITTKKWSISKLQNSIQFILYTKALGIPNVEIHNLIKNPKRSTFNHTYNPKYTDELDMSKNIKCLQTTYNPCEYEHLENIIEGAAKMISAGIFLPADPEGWICTEKWCGFYKECRGKEVNQVIFC